jgi:hypothetical protein
LLSCRTASVYVCVCVSVCVCGCVRVCVHVNWTVHVCLQQWVCVDVCFCNSGCVTLLLFDAERRVCSSVLLLHAAMHVHVLLAAVLLQCTLVGLLCAWCAWCAWCACCGRALIAPQEGYLCAWGRGRSHGEYWSIFYPSNFLSYHSGHTLKKFQLKYEHVYYSFVYIMFGMEFAGTLWVCVFWHYYNISLPEVNHGYIVWCSYT